MPRLFDAWRLYYIPVLNREMSALIIQTDPSLTSTPAVARTAHYPQ